MVNFIKTFSESSTQNQFLATISINFLTFSHGGFIGWASPFVPLLQSDLSPIGPISLDEASWVGACLAIGGVIGTVFYAIVAQNIGKRAGMLLLVLPHMAAWLLILLGTSAYYLFAARILGGCTGGGIIIQFSLYLAEISENHIRGILFSMNPLILNTGILFGFVTGRYLSYHTVPLVMLVFPTIFFILAFCLPETPQTLLRSQRYQEAELSFKFYRNIKSSSMLPAQKMEYEALKKMAEQTDSRLPVNDITIGDFTNRFAVKGLLIGIFLVILNMFSGCFAIITYTATIFQESGSSLEANLSSIIVAVIQILGTYCSTILVDRAGRKILLVVSSCGTSLGLAAMGAFSFLNKQGYDLSSLGWIPIFSLSFVVFLASIGILPLTFVVIAEVVPNKIRGIATTICLTLMCSCAFVILKVLPILMIYLQLYGCMWIFSAVCGVGTLILIVFVPETKGKSLIDDIDCTKL